MSVSMILAAILSIFPHMSGNNRACIVNNRARIEEQLTEATRMYPHIEPEVLAAVAFAETHLGCDVNEGGNWGAPISRFQRHVPGTHMHAATAFNRSLEVCGSVPLALNRWRVGFCRPEQQTHVEAVHRQARGYRQRVLGLITRIRNYQNEGHE